jgi:redox-sensitive bicupin YhaK (pirin superfamily)
MSFIASKVPAISFTSNTEFKQSYRVIGTLDMHGKGTLHALADVDPFIFLDESNLSGNDVWPFAKHPHCGLAAITYLVSGEVKSWDNHQGKQAQNNRAGGIYFINSGRGILHEEEPLASGGPIRLLQLWINPGINQPELPLASTQLFQPEEIPVYQDQAAMVRVLIGNAYGLQSPFVTPLPMQYLHVELQHQQKIDLPVADHAWHGFVYILNGEGEFGDNCVHGSMRDCLVLETMRVSDQTLTVANVTNEKLAFVFLLGKPHHQPFYKLLCAGGALVAGSEQAAEAAKLRYEQDPEHYGL